MKHLSRILTFVIVLTIGLIVIHFENTFPFAKMIMQFLSGVGIAWVMTVVHKLIFKEDF